MTAPDIFNSTFSKERKTVERAHFSQPVQIGDTEEQNELVFFIEAELLDV